MCVPFLAAAAPGAAAGAAGIGAGLGQALQIASLALTVGGTLQQARQQQAAAQASAAAVAQERAQTMQLQSIEEQRVRRRFDAQIRQQRAEIAARGLDLGSPTAAYLGQTAAAEMAFAAQSVRQGAVSRATELTAQERMYRARGQSARLAGNFSAAGQVLTAAPKLWPELLA